MGLLGFQALPIILLLFTVSAVHIHPNVHRTLQEEGSVNLIVTMQPAPSIKHHDVDPDASRSDRITDLVAQLRSDAKATQQSVNAALKSISSFSTTDNPLYVQTHSFWITNHVYIEGATPIVVEKLKDCSHVEQVRKESILPLPAVLQSTSTDSSPLQSSPEWGLNLIQAPQVWQSGNTGQDIVVSSIDTGVRGTHEALQSNYRSEYGWFDPESKKDEPYDLNGHGTHTMGTIAGNHGIGVAPGATWMSCKGCRPDGCSESDLLSCAQFILCPTDSQGNNEDCSKAPHVVSNSWGGPSDNDIFQAAVSAWEKAGIIPVFANGNSGPGCKSTMSPAEYANVIAVGATDSDDTLASFSSRGPSYNGLQKPDVSAPGKNVRSAWKDSDDTYVTISGTSMATPHVSGAVALLLQQRGKLEYKDVWKALTESCDTQLGTVSDTCVVNTNDTSYPNYDYGYGRINIAKAVQGHSNSSAGRRLDEATITVLSTSTSTDEDNECIGLEADACAQMLFCEWDATKNECFTWL